MSKQVQERVAEFRTEVDSLRQEVLRVVVGQRDVIDGVITCLLTGGHALLEGVPGLGKTVLVRTLADALHLKFARIQFTPDLMPGDILGTTVLVENERGQKTFEFRQGPVFANIVLADEINRATPKTQSALLEVMQEGSVTVSGHTHIVEQPSFVLATQNPLEMEGTYPLPEAQLDRFLLKLDVKFPTHDELGAILDRTTGTTAERAKPVLDAKRLLALRAVVREVAVAKPIQNYVIRILEATHPTHPQAPASIKRFVRYGASPRGAQALLAAAKAHALFEGHFHVSTTNVRAMAHAALRHRMILNFEGQAEGQKTDALLDTILKEVKEGA